MDRFQSEANESFGVGLEALVWGRLEGSHDRLRRPQPAQPELVEGHAVPLFLVSTAKRIGLRAGIDGLSLNGCGDRAGGRADIQLLQNPSPRA